GYGLPAAAARPAAVVRRPGQVGERRGMVAAVAFHGTKLAQRVALEAHVAELGEEVGGPPLVQRGFRVMAETPLQATDVDQLHGRTVPVAGVPVAGQGAPQ